MWAPEGNAGSRNATSSWRLRWQAVVLLGILMVAALLRFSAPDRIPPGVTSDEALNGMEGIHAVQTRTFQIFYTANNGREGLWINLIGISESIFGVNAFGLRFCSALSGCLTVLAMFLLGRELWSERVGLLCAWLVATSFWHVMFSRIAFRAIMVPLLFAASMYLLLRALRSVGTARPVAGRVLAAVGGLVYGLGFHTYIAYRFTPLVVAVLAACELRRGSPAVEQKRLVFGVWVVGAVLAALPMGVYFLQHRGVFLYRVHQVSVFGKPDWFRALAAGLFGTLGEFDFQDCSIAGCPPLLIAPVGLLFLTGVVLAVREVWRRGREAGRSWLLLSWLGLMLMPVVLTGEASGLRSIGAMPAVFLLAALGAEWIFPQLDGRRIGWTVFLLTVVAAGALDACRYWVAWPHTANIAEAFEVPKARVGRFLNTLPRETPRFVAIDRGDTDVRVPYRNADGAELPLPIGAEVVLFETYGHPAPTFVFEDVAPKMTFPSGSVIVQMYPNVLFFRKLAAGGVRFRMASAGDLPYAVVR